MQATAEFEALYGCKNAAGQLLTGDVVSSEGVAENEEEITGSSQLVNLVLHPDPPARSCAQGQTTALRKVKYENIKVNLIGSDMTFDVPVTPDKLSMKF
jgi:hypothetical protein